MCAHQGVPGRHEFPFADDQDFLPTLTVLEPVSEKTEIRMIYRHGRREPESNRRQSDRRGHELPYSPVKPKRSRKLKIEKCEALVKETSHSDSRENTGVE
jgi:hypothetical protein